MTKDHDFKAHVRARMARTGESYATARRHLLGGTPGAADQPTSQEPGDRPVLVLVARGHVDVHGRAVVEGGRPHAGPIGVELAHARVHGRAVRRRGELWADAELEERGISLAGSQSIESIDVDNGDVTVVGDGHVCAQVSANFDLVIEADGHVFVSGINGRVEVTTPDGHVRLDGSIPYFDVDTGDGHVIVDGVTSGRIRTGDGHVTLGLASRDVSIDVTADKVVIDGPLQCTGGSGTWSVVRGSGHLDHVVVETTGRVELFAK